MEIDHTEFTPYQCAEHSPVAGMMHVHPEDLDTVAAARRKNRDRPIECSDCDAVYLVSRGWTAS